MLVTQLLATPTHMAEVGAEEEDGGLEVADFGVEAGDPGVGAGIGDFAGVLPRMDTIPIIMAIHPIDAAEVRINEAMTGITMRYSLERPERPRQAQFMRR